MNNNAQGKTIIRGNMTDLPVQSRTLYLPLMESGCNALPDTCVGIRFPDAESDVAMQVNGAAGAQPSITTQPTDITSMCQVVVAVLSLVDTRTCSMQSSLPFLGFAIILACALANMRFNSSGRHDFDGRPVHRGGEKSCARIPSNVF